MEGAEHEVERLEIRGLHVGRAVDEDVHLDRPEDTEPAALGRELLVQLVDPPHVPGEALLVHAVRDRQALRVIRARDEGPPEVARQARHLLDRQRPVARRAVDLEIGVGRPLPRWIRIQHAGPRRA